MNRIDIPGPWSVDLALGWIAVLRADNRNGDPPEYVAVTVGPPTGDAVLQFTGCERLPGGMQAEQWVESTARINRAKGRPVLVVSFVDFSGYAVRFIAGSEILLGWALRSGQFALDVCYRCKAENSGRDDSIVESMLRSLRFHGSKGSA